MTKSFATAGLLSLVLAGCILLVSPPPPGGDRCVFSGEESPCGACMKEACQAAIDSCCGNSACTATLGTLEGCTTRHDGSCRGLLGPTAGADPTGAILSGCATQHCSAVCQERVGVARTSCTGAPFGEGNVCSCKLAGPPNDFVCARDTYPNTVCCAPEGWPAPGLSCSCLPLGCSPSPAGCFCALIDHTPEQTTCASTRCCVEHDTCTCGSRSCYPWETAVPSCEVRAVGCRAGQTQVTSCSIRDAADAG